MRTARLEDMVKGWFVGNFEPTLIKTNDVEVAVKSYNKGDYEEKHYQNCDRAHCYHSRQSKNERS